MNAIFPLPPPFEFGPIVSEVDPHLHGRLRLFAIERDEEEFVVCDELDADQRTPLTTGPLFPLRFRPLGPE